VLFKELFGLSDQGDRYWLGNYLYKMCERNDEGADKNHIDVVDYVALSVSQGPANGHAILKVFVHGHSENC
jgi:hypothetical protein